MRGWNCEVASAAGSIDNNVSDLQNLLNDPALGCTASTREGAIR